jgi:osmotically-inducible protein OsmY
MVKDYRNWTIHWCICLLFSAMIAGCGSTDTKESTWEYIDDSVITAKVKALIYEAPDLKIGRISIKTYKGVVLLSGFVNSSMAVAEAERLASLVKGVVYVKNSLVLK